MTHLATTVLTDFYYVSFLRELTMQENQLQVLTTRLMHFSICYQAILRVKGGRPRTCLHVS